MLRAAVPWANVMNGLSADLPRPFYPSTEVLSTLVAMPQIRPIIFCILWLVVKENLSGPVAATR